MLQTSETVFSTGVPVSARRFGAPSAHIARAARVSGFFIACASSRIAALHAISANSEWSFTRSV